MKKFLRRRTKNGAFSLIEVSVVLIIVGIFIAGIFIADEMIKKFRITAAQSLTKSSPVVGIKDSALWLESSLDTAFSNSEAETGNQLSGWNDSHNSVNKVLVTAVGTGPVYSKTINNIHAVKFSGSTSDYLQIADASFLNKSDYTILILEKRLASGGSNYFLGSTSTNLNDKLLLGYSADATVIHAQGTNYYSQAASTSSYSNSSNKARMFAFVQDSTLGKKTYINGVLAAQSSDTTQISGLTNLEIGKGYTGEIGEIAIFTRALKDDERQAIEDYYGKKWTVKIARDSVAASGGSCVGYVVTESGCDMSLASCSISQTGISTTVSPTSSPTPLSCNGNHYSGSLTYTCINGSANVSGSCVCSTGYTTPNCTGCDTNYVSDGNGGCQLAVGCTISATGITTSNVTHNASSSVTCNAGYSGSISYNCNNGSPNLSGTCTPTCSTGSTIGITTRNVNPGTGTLNCNVSNFNTSDSITYSCSGGIFSVTGGTSCDTCASGYAYSSNSCLPTCSTGSTIGITARNVNPGTGSLNCNVSNFNTSDSITYSCSGGTFSVTGGTSCDTCASGYSYSSGTCQVSTPTSSGCQSVGEGGSLTLTAPAGKTWQTVNFASYGTANSCTQGGCHASNSASTISSACIGRSTCTIGANNSVFGDPCGGTYKSLQVRLTSN